MSAACRISLWLRILLFFSAVFTYKYTALFSDYNELDLPQFQTLILGKVVPDRVGDQDSSFCFYWAEEFRLENLPKLERVEIGCQSFHNVYVVSLVGKSHPFSLNLKNYQISWLSLLALPVFMGTTAEREDRWQSKCSTCHRFLSLSLARLCSITFMTFESMVAWLWLGVSSRFPLDYQYESASDS